MYNNLLEFHKISEHYAGNTDETRDINIKLRNIKIFYGT